VFFWQKAFLLFLVKHVVCYAKKQPWTGPTLLQMQLIMKEAYMNAHEKRGVVCSLFDTQEQTTAQAWSG
jgi:hypothetical protein